MEELDQKVNLLYDVPIIIIKEPRNYGLSSGQIAAIIVVPFVVLFIVLVLVLYSDRIRVRINAKQLVKKNKKSSI